MIPCGMRKAGSVVWLERRNVCAAAHYAEAREILGDPQTFCSKRGVGVSDFTKDKPWRPGR